MVAGSPPSHPEPDNNTANVVVAAALQCLLRQPPGCFLRIWNATHKPYRILGRDRHSRQRKAAHGQQAWRKKGASSKARHSGRRATRIWLLLSCQQGTSCSRVSRVHPALVSAGYICWHEMFNAGWWCKPAGYISCQNLKAGMMKR